MDHYLRWAFDDLSIGIEDGSKIVVIVIKRPRGLSNDRWYEIAGETVKELNRLSEFKISIDIDDFKTQIANKILWDQSSGKTE